MSRPEQSPDWQPGVRGRNVRLSLDHIYLRAGEPTDTEASRPLGRHDTSPDYAPHIPLYLMDPYPEQPSDKEEAQGEQVHGTSDER